MARRCAVEAIGTALLLAAVVGSGIMGERLAGGNVAITLLANTLATGFALVALILTFGPVSGAHFNPIVTLTTLPAREGAGFIVAQFAGAVVGVATAHLMFGLPLLTASLKVRSGPSQLFSEFVATFGLILVVAACGRQGPRVAAPAVGTYIAAAYWFTASTSFANPAVTVARCLTNTFAGIRPSDVPGFIAAQCVGGFTAALLARFLFPKERP